jgi:hypothetical protein
MQPIGTARVVSNGYFNVSSGRLVPSVAPGQTVYYQVNITYPYQYAPSGFWTQPSTVLNLIAGGGSFPIPSSTNLYFPVWIEWPEPWISSGTPTNQIRIPGETFSLTNQFMGYTDLGIPTYQWRKDGQEIGSPSNFVGSIFVTGTAILSFNNFRPTDAGVYDVVVLGNDWFIGPKIYLNVQTTGGEGQLQSPRFHGTSFVCDLIGALNRVYRIQRSTDFLAWEDLLTVTNATGTVTFTNSMLTTSAAFYRAKLLP